MTSYGVTSSGFVQKTSSIILAEVEQEEKDLISPALDVSADGPLGILNGVEVGKLAELWEVAQAVYSAWDPDSATGAALDNLAALTGTIRLEATSSTVTLGCTGTAATVLSTGRVVTTGADDRFASTADATLALAVIWAINTAYVLDDIRSNDTNIYVCTQAGTSAGAGGPTGTGDGIVDNTVLWNFVGDGLSYAAVPFEAEETGPVSILAGAIDTEDSVGVIVTPVSGWEDARNTSDGTTGRDVETDAALRLRREDELRAIGNATLEAVKSDVNEVDDVTEVKGFENTTMVTDGDGVPPKSIEIVVLGGTAADIAAALWASKAGGIETYGSSSQAITDSQGDSHTMYYSRPVEKAVHTKLTYLTDSDYPATGDTLVKAAVAAWGTALGIGTDVVTSQMYDVVFGATTGIVDVTEILIGFADPPVAAANLTIGSREISTFDTTDIDLVVT